MVAAMTPESWSAGGDFVPFDVLSFYFLFQMQSGRTLENKYCLLEQRKQILPT